MKTQHKREVRALLDYAAEQGCSYEMGRRGHWKIYKDGHLITSIGGTPGSKRSMLNSRAFLNRRLAELGVQS